MFTITCQKVDRCLSFYIKKNWIHQCNKYNSQKDQRKTFLCYEILVLVTVNCILYCLLGLSWPWSYGSWILELHCTYILYMCNHCLLPLVLWVQFSLMARCIQYNIRDQVCSWLKAGRLFSPGTWSGRGVQHYVIKFVSHFR